MSPDFLTTIVAHKKQEVASARQAVPEHLLRQKATPGKGKRPFAAVLGRSTPSGVGIIAEIKRASPSKGDIRINLDPADYAAKYEAGGAAALSVLTEQAYFKGSIDDFKAARGACRLPVLRKDFMVSAYQFYESAVMGADAVLLIARILSRQQLKDYLLLSRELDLDALVEVHSETDLENANLAGADLIGINNRNLQSFETSLDVAKNLAAQLTPDQTAVAASGISTRDDIEANLACGIRNFLVGESLVRAADTVRFMHTLLGKE